MADPERPLPLATVIWFGSLEFMSLGHGYNMVLLPPRHPTNGITSSPSPGERCAGITTLKHEPSDDDEPGATAVITSRRAMGLPGPVPLSQTPTQTSSLRV
jgi:hypothetical protein